MPPQLVRLVLLIFGIVASYLAARSVLTPPSFGEHGWYRGLAPGELASRTPVYAGKLACEECHSEVLQRLAKFEHKTLSCETCHEASRTHVDDPSAPVLKPTDGHCLRCHQADPARPAWLKQITVKDHYTGQHCAECHVPHQPNEVP